MQAGDINATNTKELTNSFGWTGNNQSTSALDQHDVGELNNILFDALEKCFKGTQHVKFIPDLFFGKQSSYVLCDECSHKRSQVEDFLQLNLQVSNLKGVHESLEQLFAAEEMNGDNQVECEQESCKKKTDSRRGIQITKLPPVLTFLLNRFEFDFELLEKRKVNDRFEYPLELDMSPYLTQENLAEYTKDELTYELKSIIIHWGDTESGHYWAYIRDDL